MIIEPVQLWVPGDPVTKGSLKCVGRNGRHQLVEANPRSRSWRKRVAARAELEALHADHWQPVGVDLMFFLPRPVSHYRTGRNAALLRGNAPQHPTHFGTGDLDKLLRLVLDALQDAHLLHDDAQVVTSSTSKHWETEDDPPGVLVTVYPLDLDLAPAVAPRHFRSIETVYLPGDRP